jgi:hypothetical protein
MGILLAFAPFIAFAVVDRLVGSFEGLAAGALVSAALLVRDLVTRRTPKILEVGTFLLFTGLAGFVLLSGAERSVMGVRFLVDAGLLAIVLLSILAGRPFTLQYAREQVSSDLWHDPAFKRTNTVITAVWAVAFAVMVAADFVLLTMPEIPHRIGIIATILALVGAIKFTGWYPAHAQTAAAR